MYGIIYPKVYSTRIFLLKSSMLGQVPARCDMLNLTEHEKIAIIITTPTVENRLAIVVIRRL